MRPSLPTVPQLDVICQGSPREMGLAQGVALRTKIFAAYESLAELEAFRLKQPKWLPYFLYRRVAQSKARAFLRGTLAGEFSWAAERLAGIAAGAGIGCGPIYLLNALEPVMSDVRDMCGIPALGACSAMAIRGSQSATGEPILARNFDYLPLVQPFYTLREDRPAGGFRSLQFTIAPLVGAVDGMNEKGLCIAYNYAFALDQSGVVPPISLLISEALARWGTVAEAASWIAATRRCGAGLLMLADREGDIASLELSGTRSFLRRPEPGENYLSHTNSYVAECMRQVEVSNKAVFGAGAPTPLRGTRVLASAEARQQRFARLLKGAAPLGEAEVGRVMADHGEDDCPSGDTICVHGDYWYTTACLQWYPASGKLRVAYDTACRARFVEIGL